MGFVLLPWFRREWRVGEKEKKKSEEREMRECSRREIKGVFG